MTNRDPIPDPVALDELLRAFGIEVDPPEVATGRRGDQTPDPSADRTTGPSGDQTAGPSGDQTAGPSADSGEDRTDDAAGDPSAGSGEDRTDVAGHPSDEGNDEGSDEASDDRTDDQIVDDLLAEDTPPDDAATAPAVITIDDEDLPDAVYVEGRLEPSRGSDSGATVVFIQDDDTGDALVPSGSTSLGRGTMEPRIRSRRIAVRRAEGRRRLRWFVVVGIVVALAVAVLAVLGSPLFSIEPDRVSVTGVVYTDPAALAAVVDDLVGTPTLTVDTAAAERRLEDIAWVDQARVRTRFPSSATIEIRERSPLATFQGTDGRFRVIDREGRVLDVIDGQPVAYMLLNTPDALDLQPGQFTPPGHAAAAELTQVLPPSVRGRVVSIEVVGDGSDLRMFLDDGKEIGFGEANEILVKLVRLETVLPVADERGMQIIDVSTAEVTVR